MPVLSPLSARLNRCALTMSTRALPLALTCPLACGRSLMLEALDVSGLSRFLNTP